MKKGLIFLITSAVILPLALVFLSLKPGSKNALPLVVSQEEEEIEALVLPGKVRAEKEVELKFQTSGKLAWVGVKKGDWVKRGQAIASLDKEELEKEFKKEMNDYLNERWDFEQTHDDYQETKERHLVTDEIQRILDQAQFDLNNVVLDLEIADLAVKFAAIVSPIEGIITRIDQPVAGVNITPATAVFTVSDPGSVFFEAEADEEEVVLLKQGLRAKIILDSYPEKEFDSEIILLGFAPVSSTGSAVYSVKLSLPENTDLQFRLGMAGEVEIPL